MDILVLSSKCGQRRAACFVWTRRTSGTGPRCWTFMTYLVLKYAFQTWPLNMVTDPDHSLCFSWQCCWTLPTLLYLITFIDKFFSNLDLANLLLVYIYCVRVFVCWCLYCQQNTNAWWEYVIFPSEQRKAHSQQTVASPPCCITLSRLKWACPRACLWVSIV